MRGLHFHKACCTNPCFTRFQGATVAENAIFKYLKHIHNLIFCDKEGLHDSFKG